MPLGRPPLRRGPSPSSARLREREREHEDFYDRDPRGGGRAEEGGYERDDSPYAHDGRADEDFMAMSRRDDVERDVERDVDALRDYTVKSTKSFIRKSGGGGSGSSKSAADPFRTFAGYAAGGLAAAFLSQRFREAGAIVPLGILLGGLGYAASHLEVAGPLNSDVRNASLGAGLSSLILWAAGKGILSNEKADAVASAELPAPAAQGSGIRDQGSGREREKTRGGGIFSRDEVEVDPYRDLVTR